MVRFNFRQLADDMNVVASDCASHQTAKLDAEYDLAIAEYRVLGNVDPATLGSNDKQRDAAKARLLREDEGWTDASERLHRAKRLLVTAESEYKKLANIRRAEERNQEGALGFGAVAADSDEVEA